MQKIEGNAKTCKGRNLKKASSNGVGVQTQAGKEAEWAEYDKEVKERCSKFWVVYLGLKGWMGDGSLQEEKELAIAGHWAAQKPTEHKVKTRLW